MIEWEEKMMNLRMTTSGSDITQELKMLKVLILRTEKDDFMENVHI